MAKGYSEAVTIDEGFAGAVRTLLHFDASGDGSMTIEHKQDMEPVLQHVQGMREQDEVLGERWGEGRLVGHIPAIYYQRIALITDRDERNAAIRRFFQENPAFAVQRRIGGIRGR